MLMDTLLNVNNLILAAASANSLAEGVRNFVGPILMLVMGIVAITFLFRREMTQFIIFIVIAIVVAIIFYSPDVISNLGQDVSKEADLGSGTGW